MKKLGKLLQLENVVPKTGNKSERGLRVKTEMILWPAVAVSHPE